ncbi:MAG: hypothetical protein R6W70_10860 [bacterium]
MKNCYLYFFTLLVASLFFASGCGGGGGSSEDDTDIFPDEDIKDDVSGEQCEDGEIRYMTCTPDYSSEDNDGDETDIPDEDETDDSDIPDDGEVPDEAPYFFMSNPEGEQKQVCRNGVWEDEGDCEIPGECEDGSVRYVACGEDNEGVMLQECVGGSWEDSGECETPSSVINSCSEGETKTIACGPGGRGTVVLDCVDGKWEKTSSCDTSSCENGTTQYISCGTGYEGTLRRTCIQGEWEDSGTCEYFATSSENHVLKEKIVRDSQGNAISRELFSYVLREDRWETEGYTRKIRFSWSGGDWLTTIIYKLNSNGFYTDYVKVTTSGSSIQSWNEYKWNEKGGRVEPAVETENLLSHVEKDSNGEIVDSKYYEYYKSGNLKSLEHGYYDTTSSPDYETTFGSGAFLKHIQDFFSDGRKERDVVITLYGTVLKEKIWDSDDNLIKDYENFSVNSVDKQHWYEWSYDENGNLTSYVEKDVLGSELRKITRTWKDPETLEKEECISQPESPEPCYTFDGIESCGYTKEWAWDSKGYKKSYLFTARDSDDNPVIIEERAYASEPEKARGNIAERYTYEPRQFCQQQFNTSEEHNFTAECDSGDNKISSNGLVKMEKWTYHVSGHLYAKFGLSDKDSTTNLYTESYQISTDEDDRITKLEYTNSWDTPSGNELITEYFYEGDRVRKKEYKLSGGVEQINYHVSYRKNYSAEKLTELDFQTLSDDGTTVVSWENYKYDDNGNVSEKKVYYPDTGNKKIVKVYFSEAGGVNTAKLFDTDGSTLIESYEKNSFGKLIEVFCESSGCDNAVLAGEIGRIYIFKGVQKDYWKEKWEYNEENMRTHHRLDTGVEDEGTLVKTEPTEEYRYVWINGEKKLLEHICDYSSCYTAPRIWNEDSSSWEQHEAHFMHETHEYDDNGNETAAELTAEFEYDGSEIEHTFYRKDNNSHGVSEMFCDYRNCNSSGFECTVDSIENNPADNPDSPCHYIKWNFTYDSQSNLTDSESTDKKDKLWDKISQEWAEVDGAWIMTEYSREFNGKLLEENIWSDEGKMISEFKESYFGENEIGTGEDNISFRNRKYSYNEHGDLVKTEYMDRNDEVYYFKEYLNTYDETVNLINVVEKDSDGNILGSTEYFYSSP